MRMIQDECSTRPLDSKYKIFILDECHMLTVQAWNSMLKIFEEPPEFVIFLLCTTDPQKIIGTIMSRVQRFNFSRISTKGIENRLKFILDSENQEKQIKGISLIQYEESAVNYIARLAKGGMRDGITTLEKCLDYNENLTLENVLKVTSGGVTEQVMLQFLRNLLNKDCKASLEQFNEIYMTGVDITLFVKLFVEFLQNCTKYIITKNPSIVTISDITINWIEEMLPVNSNLFDLIRVQLINALKLKTSYASEDMKILVESWIIQECD